MSQIQKSSITSAVSIAVALLAVFLLSLQPSTVSALATVESRTGEPIVGSPEDYGYSEGYSSNMAGDQPLISGSGRGRAGAGSGAGGNPGAPMNYNQIENLKQEISDLRGLVEVQEHEIKQLKKSLQDFYVDLDKRITPAARAKSANANANPNASASANAGSSAVGAAGTATAVGAAGAGVTAATIKVGVGGAKSDNKKSGKTKANVAGAKANSKSDAKPGSPSQPVNDIFEPDQAMVDQAEFTGVPGVPGVPGATATAAAASASTFDPVLAKSKTNSANSAEKGAYESAYSMVRSKRYNDAIVAFKDYLARFPNGERSPNAHYWLAEVYMVQWQADKSKTELLDKASQDFLIITTRFPNHQKVPDSLLKLGIIENERGNLETSRQYLTQAKTNHPGTAAARIAETRLQQLR